MTDTRRLSFYLAGVLCVLVIGVLIWRAKDDEQPSKPETAERVASEPSRAPKIVRPASVRQDRETPSASVALPAELPDSSPEVEADDRFASRSVETLMARLSSDDQHLVLDSADGLRARKAVEAIPKLASIDVVQKPGQRTWGDQGSWRAGGRG